MVIDAAKGIEAQTRKLFEVGAAAPPADHHLRQQARPAGPRSLRPAAGDRARARHPRRAAQLADRQRRPLPRRVRPGHAGDPALRAGARRRLSGPGAHDQRRRSAARAAARREPARDADQRHGAHRRRRHEVRPGRVPGRPPDAGVLRQRARQLRPGGDPRRPGDAGAAAAAAAGRGRRACRAGRARLLGVRLQDPGEHEPQAPRPGGVRAHLLGRVREGHGAGERPRRRDGARHPPVPVLRRRARNRRARLPGRRPRPAQPRQVRHRRHALRRRAGALPEGAALPGRALRPRPPARHAHPSSSTPASSSSRKRA